MIQDNVENRRRSITRTFRKADVKSVIDKFIGGGKKDTEKKPVEKKHKKPVVEIYINGKKLFGKGNSAQVEPTIEDEKSMGDDE